MAKFIPALAGVGFNRQSHQEVPIMKRLGILLIVMMFGFALACGSAEEKKPPAKPAAPPATVEKPAPPPAPEHPKAEPAKPEHPTAEPTKPGEAKPEHPK